MSASSIHAKQVGDAAGAPPERGTPVRGPLLQEEPVDDLVQFLRDRLADGIETARVTANGMVTVLGPQMGIEPAAAERQARSTVRAAELKRALFEETIRPYLGTAGPTGRIAERQLRLFAAMYADHRDYREEWRP